MLRAAWLRWVRLISENLVVQDPPKGALHSDVLSEATYDHGRLRGRSRRFFYTPVYERPPPDAAT
jgi:hypothetical protein